MANGGLASLAWPSSSSAGPTLSRHTSTKRDERALRVSQERGRAFGSACRYAAPLDYNKLTFRLPTHASIASDERGRRGASSARFSSAKLRDLLAGLTSAAPGGKIKPPKRRRKAPTGDCGFDSYVGALKRLHERASEIEALPFPQRFTEVAAVITFGEPISPSLPEASRHEDDAFYQAMFTATKRLERLLAVQIWGADAFLPPQ